MADVLDDLTAAGQRPRTLKAMEYLGVPAPLFMHNEQIGWPPSKREPWITSASEPPGRLMLARYAELVGFKDVYTVGDGGNAYFFSGEGLKAFAREFTALPRAPFERAATGSDTLVLRKRDDTFYVVNVSPNPVKVIVRARGAGVVRGLVNDEVVAAADEAFSLELMAYELRTFQAERVPESLAVETTGIAE
jgi:hypothetical protein